MTFLFSDGYPKNDSPAPITFTPTFAKVYPNSGGSVGGTLITVNAPGVGVKTAVVNLFDETLNKNICVEVNVSQYGSFTCLTTTDEINNSHNLKLVVGTTKYNCANTNPDLCKYSQQLASSPVISSVNLLGNTITFDGTSFPSNIGVEFTAHASYQSMKVEATEWTTTHVVATFPIGIPFSATPISPKLSFTRKADGVVFYAKTSVSVSHPVVVSATDSTDGLSLSFAGGLKFTINKPDVYATLLEPTNRLEICGNVCSPIDDLSNINTVTCNLPALATTYSASTY